MYLIKSHWISPNVPNLTESHHSSPNLTESYKISPYLTESQQISSYLTESHKISLSHFISQNLAKSHKISSNLTKTKCHSRNSSWIILPGGKCLFLFFKQLYYFIISISFTFPIVVHCMCINNALIDKLTLTSFISPSLCHRCNLIFGPTPTLKMDLKAQGQSI